jgi:hypothetical protein
MSNKARSDILRSQADRCRRLARWTVDLKVVQTLLDLAREYDERARMAEQRMRVAR